MSIIRKILVLTALAGLAGLGICAPAQARDYLRIVGSSTVFPFAAAVAEEFTNTTSFKSPVIESTGTGGGFKLFCAEIGVGHPDITNASRRMKISEFENCHRNGVKEVVEVKIGFDGIVVANSRRAPRFQLTLRQVFLALAKEVPQDDGSFAPNPYTAWSEIDSDLPDRRIEVYGPPPTSGTRDALVELAMEAGCSTFPEIGGLKERDEAAYKTICHSVREDGAFIEAGENDNLIVQKLMANAGALGIFGFSFLDQNLDRIQGSVIDGIEPDFDSIADGSYPVARSLYFYVKKAHIGVIPGIRAYIDTFTSEQVLGDYGLLGDLGLIPLPEEERMRVRESALALEPLKL